MCVCVCACVCVHVRRKTWLSLKEEYLLLQKRSMTSLKKCITKMDERPHGDSGES